MPEADYSKREIDGKFSFIVDELGEIKIQTTKHNGRMSRMEKYLLVVASVTATLLVANGSQLLDIFKTIAL